MYLISK